MSAVAVNVLALFRRGCSRRYSVMGGLRRSDLLPSQQQQQQQQPQAAKPKVLDKFYTGRFARWTESSRITDGWDMTREHKGDLLRAMVMGASSRSHSEPAERATRRLYQRIRLAQAYTPETAERLGVDLAAARCLLGLGCRVAFRGSTDWIGLSGNSSAQLALPPRPVPGLQLEAVDARDALVMADAADWLGRLPGLRFLRLRRAPFVDDQLLASLAARCHGLQVLDLSACPGVTWEGISALWRISSLRRLVLLENPHLLAPPGAQSCVPAQLEALVPGLFVEGADDLGGLAVDRASAGCPDGIYAA